MENGIIKGKMHHYQLINDIEYEIDQPIPFSCSPGTIELSSRNFPMDDLDSNASHLHQIIKAPNKNITIYDLHTNEEAEKVLSSKCEKSNYDSDCAWTRLLCFDNAW